MTDEATARIVPVLRAVAAELGETLQGAASTP
jgi:hypothetical protein